MPGTDENYSRMDTASNATLPAAIKGKLRRRFYEAIVFLYALTRTWEVNRRPVSHDLASPHMSSFETQFRNFVNTLSQFCDAKPGGDSVTAFCVLDFQDRIQYRFACNQINKSGLERVKGFVTDLLTTLREAETTDGVEQLTFDKVLNHCRIRVRCYLNAFKAACLDCMATKPADERLLEQLIAFQKAAAETGSKDEDDHICEFNSIDSYHAVRRLTRFYSLPRLQTAHGPHRTVSSEAPGQCLG